jgi:hypothetical protein
VALMLGQLYDALRAGNVPDDKARAAAEEVANYEGEIAKLRVAVSEIKSDVEAQPGDTIWQIAKHQGMSAAA